MFSRRESYDGEESSMLVLKTVLFLAINVTQGTPWDQKKSWLLIKKKFWFGLIWVYFPKIDLWGLFFTHILVPNPVVQSEKRNNEKYRFFQKIRKVPMNQLFFQLFCLQISCHHFDINVFTWSDDYNVFKSIKKF